MRLFKMFRRNCSIAELDALKAEFGESQARLHRAAKKLSRSAELVSRQRREAEMAGQIERMRRAGAAE